MDIFARYSHLDVTCVATRVLCSSLTTTTPSWCAANAKCLNNNEISSGGRGRKSLGQRCQRHNMTIKVSFLWARLTCGFSWWCIFETVDLLSTVHPFLVIRSAVLGLYNKSLFPGLVPGKQPFGQQTFEHFLPGLKLTPMKWYCIATKAYDQAPNHHNLACKPAQATTVKHPKRCLRMAASPDSWC